MPKHTTSQIRNVALVGHADAGKTTLADHLLAKGGAVGRPGSVKEKTSLFDFDDLEHDRGHSIDSACGRTSYRDREINLIDCPGYPDFIGESVGGYNGADLVLVCVNAANGIQVNTKRGWALGVGGQRARAIVVTKCDLMDGKLSDVLGKIRAQFGDRCIPWRAPDEVGDFNEAWTEAVVEVDEDLMMRYLEGETVSKEELAKVAGPALAAGTVVPVIFTSSDEDAGLDTLLDFIVELGPSPADAPRDLVKEGGEDAEAIAADPAGPFVGIVWKVQVDKHVGKIGHVRVLRGTVKPGETFVNIRAGKKEKTGHVFRVQGKEQSEVDSGISGDLIVLLKNDSLRVGDTLAAQDSGKSVKLIQGPKPMYSLAVFPTKRGEEAKIAEGLGKLAEESFTFISYREMATHEHCICGMSQLHLDIVLRRLKARMNLEVETKKPKVPYKECVTGGAKGHYRHKKQTGGRGQFAEVYLEVAAGEPGCGLDYQWAIFGGSIPKNFEPAIEKGVKQKMTLGIIAGYPMEDITVKITDGKFHDVDSSEAAFKMAGGRAFSEAVKAARPTILEPIVKLEITIPGQYMGDVSGDLNTRRGRIQGMDQIGDDQVIKAEMPLAEAAEYSRALTSITSGEGSFTMEPSHYESVPANIQQELIAAFKPSSDDD
ncbi:MAG: elongation factor G [Planctomycetes bacterium]|nr:elongation factor G [Planctomycetota bacterium]